MIKKKEEELDGVINEAISAYFKVQLVLVPFYLYYWWIIPEKFNLLYQWILHRVLRIFLVQKGLHACKEAIYSSIYTESARSQKR